MANVSTLREGDSDLILKLCFPKLDSYTLYAVSRVNKNLYNEITEMSKNIVSKFTRKTYEEIIDLYGSWYGSYLWKWALRAPRKYNVTYTRILCNSDGSDEKEVLYFDINNAEKYLYNQKRYRGNVNTLLNSRTIPDILKKYILYKIYCIYNPMRIEEWKIITKYNFLTRRRFANNKAFVDFVDLLRRMYTPSLCNDSLLNFCDNYTLTTILRVVPTTNKKKDGGYYTEIHHKATGNKHPYEYSVLGI